MKIYIMSFVDSIVKNKPDKYQTLIESKVLAKQLELKVKQYNVLQTEYNDLVRKQTIDRKPASGGWRRIEGALQQISGAGKDWLWGVNSSDAIYTCKKPCTDSNWIRIGGSLTQIEGGDKEVWGVNSSNDIYKMNQDHSNGWKNIPGKLNNISQGGGWVWGVNSSHNVYRCKQPCDGKWILDTVGIKEDTGSIRNKNECGNAAAKIYGNAKVFKARDVVGPGKWSWVPPGCTVQSGGDWSPHWNIRSGTCKSSNMYTCVENKAPVNDDWTLVFRQTNNDWKWTKNNGGNRNIVNNNAANYSQLQNLENFRGDDGKLTFLMTYPANKTLTSPQIWKQKSNPWTVRNNSQGQVDGYEAISVPYKGNNWAGLRWNGRSCLISGSTNPPYWWYALGSFNPFGKNRIPGANSTQVNKTELYVKNKKNSTNQGPSMVQLSCSNTHVYGLDTDKRAWRKNIDGSGEWKRFGNPNNWKFYQINASSSDGKIRVVDMGRIIKETDKNGTTPWKRADNAATGVATVSGDPDNSENFYITNTSDAIYVHTPESSGGYWDNIPNENYMTGAGVQARSSNDNWKYLGQGKNIDECKVKAVQDKDTAYSSVVYNTFTDTGGWGQTCYGGVKGGTTNPQYVDGIITSLAPNGTSRLGGDKGQNMLNQMKKFQDEIQDLTKKAAEDNIGLENSKNSINSTKMARNKKMEELVERLRTDRVHINKLLREPDDIASAEDSNFQQESNYYVYFLWILLVIISLFMASHIITTDGENISTITYVFVSIWILILFKYYSQVVSSYGVSFWNYISTLLVDPF